MVFWGRFINCFFFFILVREMEELFVCFECGSENVEVIRERGREFIFCCNDCGYVWYVIFLKFRKVFFIVSKYERSFKSEVEFLEGEEIKVGDIVEMEDDEVRIIGIELEGDKRVNKVKVEEVKIFWGESLIYLKVIKVFIYFLKGII